MHAFIIKEKITSNKIQPSKELLHQLKNVLRIKPNKEFEVISNKEKFICSFDGKTILVIAKVETINSKDYQTTLVQGMPKNTKVDLIIQKATEIGVDNIYFFNAIRSVSKISEKDVIKKIERFNKIATEASEQSKRNTVPTIKYFNSLNSALKDISDSKIITLYEDEKKEIIEAKHFIKDKNISIIIGPEGGLDNKEISLLKENKSLILKLPTNILRTETAAIYTLSVITFIKGAK